MVTRPALVCLLFLFTCAPGLFAVNVTGNIYSDDDTTLANGTGTVRVYDCTNTSQLGMQAIVGANNFSVSVTAPANDTLLCVYLDTGTGADLCMTAFLWAGGGVDQTNLHLRKGFLRFNKNGAGVDFTYGMTNFTRLDSGTNAGNILAASGTAITTDSGDAIGLQLKNSASLTTSNAGTLMVNGPVVLDAGTTLVTSTTTAFTAVGTFTNNGTLTAGAATVTARSTYTNNATITWTTGTMTFTTGNADINSGGTAAGTKSFFNVTINSTGTKTLVTNGINIDGALLMTAGTFACSTFTVTVAGNFTNASGGTTFTTGTLELDGSDGSNDNIVGGSTGANLPLNHVVVNTGDTKTIATSDINIDGNLTITAGTLAGGTRTIYLAGLWINNAAFTCNTGTVVFNGGNQDINSGGTGAAQRFYNVIIDCAGFTKTLITNDIDIDNDLTLTAGALNDGGRTIYVGDDWTNNVGTSAFVATGTVYFDTGAGASDGAVGGTGQTTFNNMTVNRTTGTTAITNDAANNIVYDINGSLSILDGQFEVNAVAGTDLDVDGDVTLANVATAALNLDDGNLTVNFGGSFTNNNTAAFGANLGLDSDNSNTITFNATSGTKTIQSGNGTSVSTQWFAVTFNDGGGGATWVLASDINIDGLLTLTSGTFDVSASNYAMSLAVPAAGSCFTKNGGTFNPRSGTVTLDGGVDASIDGASQITFYDLVLNRSSGADAASNTAPQVWDINGTLTITAGVFEVNDTGAVDLDVDGDVSIANSTNTCLNLDDTGLVVTFGGSFTNSNAAAFSATRGLDVEATSPTAITFDAASGAKTIQSGNGTSVASEWYNITFNDGGGGATWTLASDMNCDGAFTITSGTVAGAARTLSVAGDYTNNSTITWTTGTMTFDGGNANVSSGGTALGTKSFYNVTVNSTGTKTLVANTLNIDGALTMTAGTLACTTFTVTVAQNFTNGGVGATFTTGTLELDGTTAGTIDNNTDAAGATYPLNHVVVNTTNTKTLSDRINIDGNLTVTAGTLDANSRTIFLAGIWTNNATVNWSTGILNLNGASNQNFDTNGTGAGKLLESLTIDCVGFTKTIVTNDCYCGGAVTITAGTLDTGTKDLYLEGNFANSGTFTANTRTVYFVGATTGTLSGTSLTSFYNLTLNRSTGGQSLANTAPAVFKITNNLNLIDGRFEVNDGTGTDCDVDGNVTISVGGGFNIDDSGIVVNLGGSITNASTTYSLTDGIQSNTGATVNFDGTAGPYTIQSSGDSSNTGARWGIVNFNSAGVTWALTTAFLSNDKVSILNGTLDVDVTNNYAMTVADWTVTSGTFQARAGTVTIAGGTTATGLSLDTGGTGAGKSFYNLTIATVSPGWSSVTVITNDLDVDNNLTVTSTETGGTGLNGGSRTIYIGGNFTAAAPVAVDAFDGGTGTVILDGSANCTITGIPAFNILTVNKSSASVTVAPVTGLDVNGTLTITVGTVNITAAVNTSPTITIGAGGTLNHNSGGTMQVTTSISVTGKLAGNGTGILKLDNAGAITVNSGGQLEMRGTNASTRAGITGTTAGTDIWTATIANGGTLDARYATFNTGVITLGATPTKAIVTDSTFTNVPNSTNYFMDISSLTTTRLTLQRLTFTRGSGASVSAATVARNIRCTTSTAPITTVTGYTGTVAGETFDNDANNRVRWTDNWIQLQKDDGATSSVTTLEEALTSLGAGTLTVRATYDSGGIRMVAANDITGKVTLPNFSGTLNLDGLVFRTAGVSYILDTSAVTSGGTINLYNCVLADPEHVGSARQLINPGAGNAVINANWSTIDSNAATAGLTSTSFSLYTFPIVNSTWVSYATRNLRLSKSGAAGTSTDVPNGTYTRDADGKTRPNPTTYGAYDYQAEIAMYVALTDITDGEAAGNGSNASAVQVTAAAVSNSAANVHYITSSDGTYCYLTVVNRTNMAVVYKDSWAGCLASYPTHIQTSDASNKYWVYVPYDKDGDGSYDTIRKLLHTNATSLVDSGDVGDGSGNLSNSTLTDTDITANSGWGGLIYLLSTFITGGSETQIALTTQDGSPVGEVHIFFVNRNSGNGGFYGDVLFALANRASESYTSGTFALTPVQSAPVTVTGSGSGGVLEVVRTAGSGGAPDPASYVSINRVALGAAVNTGDVVNAFTGPAAGDSFTTDPVFTMSSSGRRYAGYGAESKAVMVNPTLMTGVEVNASLAGFGGVSGFSPLGNFQAGVTFMPLFNSTTGVGAMVAIEYKPEIDADALYEVLDSTYSDTRIRYNGAAGTGSFSQGVAYIVGRPTTMLYNYPAETLTCGTEAGMIYSWSIGGKLATEDTSNKGTIRTGFPIGVSGGRITKLSAINITDATLMTALNMSVSGLATAVFTSTGEVILLRPY